MLNALRLHLYSTSVSHKFGFIGTGLQMFKKYSTENSHRLDSSSIPKPRIKWFYATDVPNSKPLWNNYTKEKEPKKFIPFSDYDSGRLEKKYQKFISDKQDDTEKLNKQSNLESHIVEVNEDKLFQVNLKNFDLSPVYWDGPVYEVRRGTWFTSDGNPVAATISLQIEKGYRFQKAYKFGKKGPSEKQVAESKEEVTKFNKELKENGKPEMAQEIDFETEKDTFRLDNDQVVLFCNEKEAVVFPSSFDSKFQLGVIRSFGSSSGSLISVEKIQRGFSDSLNETVFDNLTTNPIPGLRDFIHSEISNAFHLDATETVDKEKNGRETERVIAANQGDQQMKNILESDFDHDTSSLSSEREVDHLILCIHGIGQILGHKYESANFVHSINVLRNTMKEVYQNDRSYQELAYPDNKNNDDENINSNNRIQILPISWRHKIDFHPQKSCESFGEDGKPRLPSLAQISVDGIKPLRNILGDVVLDILLYYEPKYIDQIIEVVTNELNRVYSTYMERNPNFKGKVHIMGHSLGSVISFDILSSQPDDKPKKADKKDLLFDVDDFFCVGSPIGMFKLLSQTNIKPRSLVPRDFNPNETNTFASPKCNNLYNIFHRCDPIGYRIEPLIKPEFSRFKPELVPFAVKGINTQINEWAHFSEEIQEKLLRASSWFNGRNKREKTKDEESKSIEEKALEENALDDILFDLAKSERKDDNNKKPKNVDLSKESLSTLIELNMNGRVDYSLPMGVFDFSLVSAISAHISYFEDKDTAGFIMKQLLRSRSSPIKSKTVSLYN